MPVTVYITPSVDKALTLRSPSLTLPSLYRKILALLISLCTIFAECRASTPSSKCLKMCHILLSLINCFKVLAYSSFEWRSPESASSMTMQRIWSSSTKKASLYTITFLCRTEAKIRISFKAACFSFFDNDENLTYFIAYSLLSECLRTL